MKKWWILFCVLVLVVGFTVNVSAKSCQLAACEEQWGSKGDMVKICLQQQIDAMDSYHEKYGEYFDSIKAKAEEAGDGKPEFSFEERLVIDCMRQCKLGDCYDARMMEPCIDMNFEHARKLGKME